MYFLLLPVIHTIEGFKNIELISRFGLRGRFGAKLVLNVYNYALSRFDSLSVSAWNILQPVRGFVT